MLYAWFAIINNEIHPQRQIILFKKTRRARPGHRQPGYGQLADSQSSQGPPQGAPEHTDRPVVKRQIRTVLQELP